jgi:hypothetical protein
MRGKHNTRHNKIKSEVWQKFDQYINTLPYNESHYSIEKTAKKYFEDSSLNITKLYKNFMSYLFANTGNIYNLCFVTFYFYFKHNYNYGFSKPRSDFCDTCFEYSQIGLNNLPHNDKILFQKHLEKVEFYMEI